MKVQINDVVSMRDGRIVQVTDVSDSDENGMVSTGPYEASCLMPAETIFVGELVSKPRFFRRGHKDFPKGSRPLVVSDESEVLVGIRGSMTDPEVYGVGFKM